MNTKGRLCAKGPLGASFDTRLWRRNLVDWSIPVQLKKNEESGYLDWRGAVIAVVEGAATCIVEDRSHALTAGAMLLQPPGRVFSIGNETGEPMTAIWICARPVTGRRVVA